MRKVLGRKPPMRRMIGTLALFSGTVAAGQNAAPSSVLATLAYYQSLDATPWPDYQKLRNGLPWKYAIKFNVGPNQQQVGNLGSPPDPAFGRFTVARNGANLTYSIENDASFPIFADFVCSYSDGSGDVQPGYLAVAQKTTRAFTWQRPLQVATSATCTASVMEGGAMPPTTNQPNNLDAIDLWISNQIAIEQENKVTMSYSYSEPTIWGKNTRDGSDLLGTHEISGSFTVGVTSFSLMGCNAIFVLDTTGNRRVKLIFQPNDPEPDAPYHSTITSQNLTSHHEERINLKDVQPSKIGSYMTDAYEWTNEPPSCNQPHADCKVADLYFEAAADSFTNLDTGQAQGDHSFWMPVTVPADGPRLVKAFHDAAVACGAKDVNATLY